MDYAALRHIALDSFDMPGGCTAHSRRKLPVSGKPRADVQQQLLKSFALTWLPQLRTKLNGSQRHNARLLAA